MTVLNSHNSSTYRRRWYTVSSGPYPCSRLPGTFESLNVPTFPTRPKYNHARRPRVLCILDTRVESASNWETRLAEGQHSPQSSFLFFLFFLRFRTMKNGVTWVLGLTQRAPQVLLCLPFFFFLQGKGNISFDALLNAIRQSLRFLGVGIPFERSPGHA